MSDAPEVIKLGRDVDVSIPMAASTDGIAVSAGLVEVIAEIVEYARAGGLVLDWSSLKVGVEVTTEGMLPPLRIRARINGRRPL